MDFLGVVGSERLVFVPPPVNASSGAFTPTLFADSLCLNGSCLYLYSSRTMQILLLVCLH